MKLLLVEDDVSLGKGIKHGIEAEGYACNWVQSGELAQATLETEEYSLVVLDLGLPVISGLEVLRWLRRRHNHIPVLILTARDSTEDRITGLDSGADDYVVKPFDLDELYARIRALLRRQSGRGDPIIRYKNLEIDPAAHVVKKAGEILELSAKEFALLQLLVENSGRVLSKNRLEQGLYSWKTDVDSNTVEVHIHHLRKKLGADFIRTIRGVGYTMDKDNAPVAS